MIKPNSLGKHPLKSSLKGALLRVLCSLLGKKEIISNYMGMLGCPSARSYLHTSLYLYASLLPSKPDFCCTSNLSTLLYSLQEKIITIGSRLGVGFRKER